MEVGGGGACGAEKELRWTPKRQKPLAPAVVARGPWVSGCGRVGGSFFLTTKTSLSNVLFSESEFTKLGL